MSDRGVWQRTSPRADRRRQPSGTLIRKEVSHVLWNRPDSGDSSGDVSGVLRSRRDIRCTRPDSLDN